MSTFVYMTRCDGCGMCVDICPSDIMHIDPKLRRAVNIEPHMCWEWGQFIPKVAEENTPSQKDLDSQTLYNEPKYLKLGEFRKAVNEDGIPNRDKKTFKQGVYY